MMVETNLDDMPAEYLGNSFQKNLLLSGAIDFFFTSIQMKKGRPALKVSVLCHQDRLEKISDFLLEHTSTIGVRYYPVRRNILDRASQEVDTSFGKVWVKTVVKPSGKTIFKIEYESLLQLSKEHELSILKLQMELNKELMDLL